MQCTHHHIYNHPAIIKLRCDAVDQGAHIRERLTANRSDLIMQREPNQHGTRMPHRTTRTNHSPPRLELQEPAQRHMVSRAQRETTKSKQCIPISPQLLNYPRSWLRVPVLSKQGSTRLTDFDYLLLPACG